MSDKMKTISKKASVIKKTMIYMVIQCVSIFAIFGVYIGYTYSSVMDSEVSAINDLVIMFGGELDNKIEGADLLLEQMIYKNDDYDILKSEREADRYYASRRLRDMMIESLTYDRNVDTFVIAESVYDTCIDYSNARTTYEQRNKLRDFTMEKAKSGRNKAEWQIEYIGNNQYLYKMYVWQGEAAAVYISVDSFLDSNRSSDFENTKIVLIDRSTGEECGSFGDEAGLKYSPIGNEYVLLASNYGICAYINGASYLKLLKADMVVVFFIFAVVVTFTVFMIRHLRTNIIRPISNIQKNMETIQEGDYGHRINDVFLSNEFDLLKDTFNKLMDEVVGLKIQTYEKQLCLQETELKCVKLQIRPHFFLNAMTTISSLSQQGRDEEIRLYIDALSKNIKYMFRSGLHTVALDEEIRHVENYFEMQELKYPGCVFYFVDASEEAKKWRIPQMLIHTVIENEYKYAVAMNTMLTILIRAELVEKDENTVLKIEVEDDGKGYPEEVLEQFADSTLGSSADGSRVGLWSIKRMLEIMYEEEGLFTIENIEPHGCKNVFFIPKEPLHEVVDKS